MYYFIKLTTVEEVQACIDYLSDILHREVFASDYTKEWMKNPDIKSWPYLRYNPTVNLVCGVTDYTFHVYKFDFPKHTCLINDFIQHKKPSSYISIF